MPKDQKTYKEPTCVKCGCTEFTACLVGGVGCAWVKLDKKTNAGVCSACVGRRR